MRKSEKPNIFILGFPRCGTSFLFQVINQNTVFIPFNDANLYKKLIFKSNKEPNILLQANRENWISDIYLKGNIIDGSQLYLPNISYCFQHMAQNDIFIFVIRDRIEAITSLINLKKTGQDNAENQLDDVSLGMPTWLFRDLMYSSDELFQNIKRDFFRGQLINPKVTNGSRLVQEELKYFNKYQEWPFHSYLATYFYGHRITNFLSTTGIKEFVVIKFEDLIGNPNETLQKIGERYSFKINPIFKKPNETARWATKEKTISINDFARKTLNKLYTYDDDILDRYREKFLDV